MKIKNLRAFGILGALCVPGAAFSQPPHHHHQPDHRYHGRDRDHDHNGSTADGLFLASLTATTVAWALTTTSVEAHERDFNSLVAQDAREFLGTDPVARVATPRLAQKMEDVRGQVQGQIETYVGQYVRDASDVKRLGAAMATDLPDETIATYIVMNAS